MVYEVLIEDICGDVVVVVFEAGVVGVIHGFSFASGCDSNRCGW